MKKQTKIIIGVGAVAIFGYLVWKQSKKKSFANAEGTHECQKPFLPCPRLAGACYTPTRGSIPGTAPIGCFGNPGAPIPLPPQQTPPIIPISPRG
jgi:hypothetical protein